MLLLLQPTLLMSMQGQTQPFPVVSFHWAKLCILLLYWYLAMLTRSVFPATRLCSGDSFQNVLLPQHGDCPPVLHLTQPLSGRRLPGAEHLPPTEPLCTGASAGSELPDGGGGSAAAIKTPDADSPELCCRRVVFSHAFSQSRSWSVQMWLCRR